MRGEAAIAGWVAPGFDVVQDAFAANFRRGGDDEECGAALAVYLEGRCVADLWGGFTDAARTRPWARDTLVNVWSASKGVTALAVAMLVDQGRARYDDAVAMYWPEFAANGKAGVTLGQILSHQSGVNGWEVPTSWDDLYDWATATARLAAQAPFWAPGTLASYHAVTHGFLAGEVVRRITGQDVGGFIRDAIATPLGADFHVGLAAAQDWRVAELIGPPPANAIPGGPGLGEIARRAVTNPVEACWAGLNRDTGRCGSPNALLPTICVGCQARGWICRLPNSAAYWASARRPSAGSAAPWATPVFRT